MEKKTVVVVAPPGAERDALCCLLEGAYIPLPAEGWREAEVLIQAGAPAVSPEENAAELWRSLALRDSLTGLWNRRGFLLRCDELLQGCSAAALLYLDVDDFKAINDSRGHAFGDEVLAHVGRELENAFRLGDAAARLAGDEFAVFLPGLPAHAVEEGCRRLRRSLSRGYRGRRGECAISCSVGAALYPGHGTTVATLLENADAALYAAKAKGKNNWVFFGEAG